MRETILLKIRNDSEPQKVAGAVVAYLREGKKVELQAIGAGAVNQAVKSIAVARGFIAQEGINLSCIPAFTDVEVEEEERTGIKFIIKEDM